MHALLVPNCCAQKSASQVFRSNCHPPSCTQPWDTQECGHMPGESGGHCVAQWGTQPWLFPAQSAHASQAASLPKPVGSAGPPASRRPLGALETGSCPPVAAESHVSTPLCQCPLLTRSNAQDTEMSCMIRYMRCLCQLYVDIVKRKQAMLYSEYPHCICCNPCGSSVAAWRRGSWH